MNERLAYPISDASSQLGISRSALYALEKEGQITFTKIGRRSVVRAEELKRFLDDAANKGH